MTCDVSAAVIATVVVTSLIWLIFIAIASVAYESGQKAKENK